ncbi:uncharacterized protein LOC109845039 isoform X2 [Asparagus officinalis]|uniref:uncharacterized protein LOC109845039 isoform X2 n=1 Tax=Asparagus officinalis TaxID=4686 RepID=UPI00098E08B9|nr:uncharacterized protein LOC109845039 isoform X2 [Asparagus officinalis]
MAESSSSIGKKRAREDDDENNLTYSDTAIALQMMRSQFPKVEKVAIQPFILQSQLYSSVKDRTQVDRDLESLKKEKVLRLFKLNTGQDDHAIMFMDDYLKQVETSMKRLQDKDQQDIRVFDWFKRHVIESKLDVSIDHQELVSQLHFNEEQLYYNFLHLDDCCLHLRNLFVLMKQKMLYSSTVINFSIFYFVLHSE